MGKHIIDSITSEEEMEGLLCWALVGLNRLLANKSFSYSPSTNEVKNKWLRKSDSCMGFILDYIMYDYESHITKKEFKNRYVQYCTRHKLKISNDKTILHLLNTQMGAYDSQRRTDDGNEQIWNCVRFKFENKEKEDIYEKEKEQKKLVENQDVVVEKEDIQDVVVEK